MGKSGSACGDEAHTIPARCRHGLALSGRRDRAIFPGPFPPTWEGVGRINRESRGVRLRPARGPTGLPKALGRDDLKPLLQLKRLFKSPDRGRREPAARGVSAVESDQRSTEPARTRFPPSRTANFPPTICQWGEGAEGQDDYVFVGDQSGLSGDRIQGMLPFGTNS